VLKIFLPPIPIKIPPIAIFIAILATKLSALVPRLSIVPVVQIAAKLAPFVSDPRLIVPNIPPVAPSVLGKQASRAQSQHQQNSCNRPFHVFTLLRVLRILLNANPQARLELWHSPFI
jgi:hypothetical protein